MFDPTLSPASPDFLCSSPLITISNIQTVGNQEEITKSVADDKDFDSPNSKSKIVLYNKWYMLVMWGVVWKILKGDKIRNWYEVIVVANHRVKLNPDSDLILTLSMGIKQ